MFLISFLITFIVDFIWVFYNKNTIHNNSNIAGLLATLIYLLGGINIISYTSNKILLIPAALGAFFGTKAAIKFSEYLNKKNIN
jgi:hypothetical protein